MNTPLPKNAIATTLAEIQFFSLPEAEQLAAIESSLYPGAKPESIKLVIANCRAQVLDPMTKPFHIVPMQVRQRRRNGEGSEYVWRDVVMPGIELYRIKAARTGAYAGLDPAQWGDDITETLGGEEKLEWDEDQRRKVAKGRWETVQITYPEWCEVTVYRIVQGVRCAFPSGRVYWKETYATAGRGTSLPNEMWRKRTRGQLEKCAEALALRRGFPEIGAMPTVEEMIGKVLDPDAGSGIVVEGAVTVEQPRPKSSKQSASTSTSAPAAPAEPNLPSSTANGSKDGEALDATPLKPNQVRIIRANLANAGMTELDLEAAFPNRSLEPKDGKTQFAFEEFNALVEWIAKNAKV